MTDIEKISEWLGSGSINIFGMPFAGKDTQGRRLAEALGATRLSGGEILRNSEIPEHVRRVVDEGGLAPTDDYIAIVLPYLSSPEFAGRPLVLSSVGRWIGEEQGVLEATKASGHETKAVLFLNIDESVVRERWQESQTSGGRMEVRADDEEHKLDVRLDEYRNKTLPVIDVYRDMGLLIELDSTQDVDVVSDEIIKRLVEFAERS